MTQRVGFVGVGGIASIHLDTVDQHPEATVRAVADVDSDRAEATGASYDAAVYTDGEELIASEELDALVIAVPPFAHGPYERQAAERGLDLFVEKPVGLAMEAVDETRELVERAGVLTQVGYVCRYGDITERARELLDGRAIGTINSTYWSEVPPTAWWGERAKSGGQLVEQSTHVFDLHRYLAGDVSTVVGSGTDGLLVDGIDFQDATSVTMVHDTGCVSHVSSTCAAAEWRFEVDVVADGAQLSMDFTDHTLTGVVDGEEVTYEGRGTWYERELRAFLDAVGGSSSASLRSPYADGMETLRLTLAAQEAVDIGARVER